MKLNKQQKDVVLIGLNLYKTKLKKMLGDSQTLKVAEEKVKQSFLETERLMDTITRDED